VQALATALPFPDHSFDVVWSNYVLEHVAEPETMLSEIMRVLKPGGHLFISAAWQAGTWLSTGYPVRPWSDFDWKGKLIKASVPIRGSVRYRAMKIAPQRLARLASFHRHPRPSRLRYRKLHPSYEKNWMPDATAACSVEPFEVYLWYVSRGATCLNYPTSREAFLIRTGPLTFRMPSDNRGQ
jgi:ubiquinone/menaquinone biosynthesis C-methylase UbiE